MSPTPPSHRRPLWQFLLPPMLLASLGLHGLVLLVPIAPSSQELEPPPDLEDDGIDISRIDPPQSGLLTPTAASLGATSSRTAAVETRPSAADPAAEASHPRAPSLQGRGRRPAASRGEVATGATPAADSPVIAALPSPPAENPNPPAPTVTAAATDSDTDILNTAQRQLQTYLDIFATYQGQRLRSEAVAVDLQALWLKSFTASETAVAAAHELTIQPLTTFDPIPYEAGLCLPSPPQTAQILVWVDSEGRPDSDVLLLQSTGYRRFNEKALAQVAGYTDYPEAAAPRAYRVEIPVEYDADTCQWPPVGEGLPEPDYFTLLRSYTGPAMTTLAEANVAQAAWLARLQAEDAISDLDPDDPAQLTLPDLDIEVPYPLNRCLPMAPTDSQWGVVVAPEGNLAEPPTPLRSTGYEHFDNQAKTLLDDMEFPTAEVPQAYIVTLPVDYNALLCRNLDDTAPETARSGSATDDDPTPADTSAATRAPAATVASAEQIQLMEAGRQHLASSSYGSLNQDTPDLVVSILESSWPEAIDQACFLEGLDPDAGPVPVPEALDAFLVNRNVDQVPESLAQLYGPSPERLGEYCQVPLYRLAADDATLFASVVGVGFGNSNTLVVLWPVDPHQ